MPFNIDAFKANGLVAGGARPTLFEVALQFPTSVVNAQFAAQKATFLCMAAQLPAFLQDEIRVPYFGRTIKVAGDRTFQDWKITIMNDEDFAIRNAFESWQNLMNTLVSNRLAEAVAGPIGGNDTYKCDLTVSQYAKSGPPSESGIIRQYQIIGAFPNTIDPIPLGWDMVNRVEQFDVTFSYDYFIPGNGTTPAYQPVLSPE